MEQFDDERSKLFKWSADKGIPTRLVVILKDKSFKRLSDVIKDFKGNKDFDKVVKHIINISSNQLDTFDIVYSWYDSVKNVKSFPSTASPKYPRYQETQESQMELSPNISGYSDSPLDQINRWFVQNRNKEQYGSLNELVSGYDSWEELMKEALDLDNEKTKSIIKNQKELSGTKPVLSTDYKLKESTLIIKVKFEGEYTSAEIGEDLFNRLTVTEHIPVVTYIRNPDSDNYLTKVYTKDISFNDLESLGSIAIPRVTLTTPHTLYFRIDNGGDNIGRIFLEKSVLELEIIIGNKDLILSRLGQAFGFLNFETIEESKISAEFYALGTDIFLPSFLNLILTEPLFSNYLHVVETGKPQALKKRLTMKYYAGSYKFLDEEDGSYIGVTLKYVDAAVGVVLPKTGKSAKGKKSLEEKYLSVTVTRSPSYNVIELFKNVFTRMLGKYVEYDAKRRMKKEYIRLFPELANNVFTNPEKEVKEGKKKEREETTLDLLSRAAPHIFIRGYGSNCQSVQQPHIIPDDEVAEWEAQTFKYGGKDLKRQVMRYPNNPDEEQYNIVCMNEDYPFPGVKKNNKSNKEQYPYVPCCFESDQTDPSNRRSDYNVYYKGHVRSRQSEDILKQIRQVIIKYTPLGTYRLGKIPSSLTNILEGYSPNTKWSEKRGFYRLGMPSSNSSLLHAICEAIDDPKYIYLNEDRKEEYVVKLRGSISNEINLNVTKQEMWEFNVTEINDKFSDKDIFLDPSLFYRVLEEYFNINIFTFAFDGNSIRVEIPRHKVFHASTPRMYRNSIIIIRHTGTSVPQCDLVIDINVSKLSSVKIFSGGMTEILYKLLRASNITLTFSFEAQKELVTRSDLYSHINYRELLGNIKAQYIDKYGKNRAIIFESAGNEITMIGIPCQPENVKIVRLDQLPLARVSDVMNVFGIPDFVHEEGSKILGLWYPIFDIKQGVYIPVEPSKIPKELVGKPKGGGNPLNVTYDSSLSKLRKLRELAIVFQQMVEYLFDVYRMNLQNPSVKTFVDKYTINLNLQDPFERYSPNIQKMLPKVENVQDAISELSKTNPTYFEKGKLLMYNLQLRDNIRGYLENYLKNTKGLEIVPRKRIELLTNEKDFIPRLNTLIFMSERDLEMWITSQKVTNINVNVIYKLDLKYGGVLDPYVYYSPNGIYMVQNVAGGDLSLALTVALVWLEKKSNLGPNPEKREVKNGYTTYGVSITSDMIVIKTNSGVGEQLEVLAYTSTNGNIGRYAAMLPLLQ